MNNQNIDIDNFELWDVNKFSEVTKLKPATVYTLLSNTGSRNGKRRKRLPLFGNIKILHSELNFSSTLTSQFIH